LAYYRGKFSPLPPHSIIYAANVGYAKDPAQDAGIAEKA
jgi:hypothetical protein